MLKVRRRLLREVLQFFMVRQLKNDSFSQQYQVAVIKLWKHSYGLRKRTKFNYCLTSETAYNPAYNAIVKRWFNIFTENVSSKIMIIITFFCSIIAVMIGLHEVDIPFIITEWTKINSIKLHFWIPLSCSILASVTKRCCNEKDGEFTLYLNTKCFCEIT